MLKSLNIENIAIIEKASVDFSDGLNILTGETGAGKSILIDSINAVTGEKTSRELIRSGENSASVRAFFDGISPFVTKKLADSGLPVENDNTVLLQRTIYKDGKNDCRINGAPVTVSMLRNIGMSLINIHGQRDSQSLLDSERHIDYLDSFALLDKLSADYQESFRRLKSVMNEIKALNFDEEYKERRIDILTYQINELTEAQIKIGEREALNKKKNVLNSTKKLRKALRTALMCLSGDGESFGAEGLVQSALTSVTAVSSLAKGLDALTENLNNAENQLEICSDMIEDVLSQLESMDGNIEDIEERLDILYRLSKKYGETEEEMLEFLKNAKEELNEISLSDERLKELDIVFSSLLSECKEKAAVLSEKRRAAAGKLSKAVLYELSFLDMPNCRFEVNFLDCDMNIKGTDSVEFLISANPGEALKPLGKVASGGELSRVMLALKNVLHREDSAYTLIFDEIDTGVSGSAARRIAVKLSEVSERTQVLCITHLAQIAAFADSHKFLYKTVIGDKTYTKIKELHKEDRPLELARMTHGNEADEIHISSAKQMILSADNEKEARHKR